MQNQDKKRYTRREFLRNLSLTAMAGMAIPVLSSCSKEEAEDFLQKHFHEMTPEEKKRVIAKLEERYSRKYGKKFEISTKGAVPNTLWGYGLELSRCIGCRRCVYACAKENNNSRYKPQLHWIRVLRLKRGSLINLENSEHYYDPPQYSDSVVVDERFVLHVPSNLELAGAAPLLCAGITTYSPMRHWGVAKGKKAGVVGLGGLGHMGVKFAHALGAHVVVFTTSPGKKEDALRLGADEVAVSRNADEMKKHAGSFDFILDAVSADHDINAYIQLLRRDGNITLVGAPEKPLSVSAFGLLMRRRSLSGSPIGGIPETQEMLDFCGAHDITADVEVIPIQKVNEAYERLLKSDVKYRFSIDMASLKSE